MEKEFKLDDINQTVSTIFSTFDIIEETTDKITTKITDIKKVLQQFKDNKTISLTTSSSYLNFQIELLVNEKEYLEKIQSTFFKKMHKELTNIYDYVIMVLSSLENLEIDNEEAKNNIIKKTVVVKKPERINRMCILQVTDAIIINLDLINKFVDLFEVYIQETSSINNMNNIHCNSLYTILRNKKSHIELEHCKYITQFDELIRYFSRCSSSIKSQVEKPYFINFLVEKNA